MTILATDVQYRDRGARAAGVLFEHWGDARPVTSLTRNIAVVQPYRPGHFFERELPCLIALIDKLQTRPNLIIVDGFVHLGSDARPGLGRHLFETLDRQVPVVGVAKSAFTGTPKDTELLRGNSKTPLYVTSVGLHQDAAKDHIRSMHGPYRIPTLLRLVDRLARGDVT